MHETLVPLVKGHIDENNNTNFIRGWAFLINLTVAPIRLLINGTQVFDAKVEERRDVSQFYRVDSSTIDQCGYSISYHLRNFEIEDKIHREIQMWIQDSWVTFHRLPESSLFQFSFNHQTPSCVVVDNFYSHPYAIREFALQQQFILHPSYHKGRRTETSFATQSIKEKFENILGKKITGWDCYKPTNGCFQLCKNGDEIVYHSDSQNYAGIIYLTPDAPLDSGTSFFRSKHTKKMKFKPDEYGLVFPNGHLTDKDFDQVDQVGNVFNRLVLFDAKLLHSATRYFGDQDDNCRLFQMFFFDVEE
jgi:hypothetical protein